MSAEGSLESLVAATARAVVATQTQLDRVSTEGDGVALAIPRAATDVEFRLERRGGYRFLFGLAAQQRREKHRHRLRLALVSTPDPPPDPLPGKPVERLQLLEPVFMVAPSEEQRLYDRLLEVLRDPSSPRRWLFVSPRSRRQPEPRDLEKEIDLIRRTRSRPTPNRGLVAFRLAAGRYLVARLTGKSRRDGLFEIVEGGPVEVLIYSYRGDRVGRVVYRPLHELALAVRRWLRTREVGPATPLDGIGQAAGWSAVRDVARRLWRAYHGADAVLREHARRFLAARAARPLGYLNPPFFTFDGLSVELGYSLSYDRGRDGHRFSFVNRDPFLESRVEVRPRPAAAEMDVRLVAPGFVLIDDARESLVELAVENAEGLAAGLAPGGAVPAAEYLRCLRQASYRTGVVALLSFEENVPTEEFLLVWPGSWAGERRDFAFTCRRTRSGLVLQKVVLRLEQSAGDPSLDNPREDVDPLSLGDKEYKAFHNFFHAVRIWRSRLLEKADA